MSKMAEMAQTIEELRTAAASINAVADWLYQQFSSDDNEAQATEAPTKKEPKPALKLEDVRAVLDAVEKAGFDPYEKKLLGITAMQKLLGKSRFDELLTTYIEKPQGKPTLVPDSDKRPAMNTAKNDFMEENDNE